MKYEHYRDIYSRLKTPKDIDRLAEELKIDKELLLVIYTQRTVRDATRRYYIIKKDIKKMARDWRKGITIVKMARRLNFPPVLLGLLLAPEINVTRKEYWKYIRNPDSCQNKRLKKELKHVAEADIIYSPKGSEVQTERGKWGEGLLHDWLDRRDLCYRTEEDLRATHKKTPDVLLEKPMKINGTDVHWIESKASFGDEVELKKNVRRQLKPYTELFGAGAVVYWFGFIEGIEPPEGIMLLDGRYFGTNI